MNAANSNDPRTPREARANAPASSDSSSIDWDYPSGAGSEGIYEIGRRMAAAIDRIPDATTFTNDAREMLRITRRVESAARGGRLFVGFQNASKLEAERERYEELVKDGTEVIAFGEGDLADPIAGLEYRTLEPHHERLANNWILVTDTPERVAFVSWEISDSGVFGTGGAGTPGKAFVGFITDDAEVIDLLVKTLSAWPPAPPTTAATPAAKPAGPNAAGRALMNAIERTEVQATGAKPGAVVVAVRRDDPDQALITAAAIAKSEERQLVVVDRSTESIFGTPYNDLRGDDDFRPRPDRLFNAGLAAREGRQRTANVLAAATALSVEAGGWFPTRSGSDGLAEAMQRFGGSIMVLPGTVRAPSIGERIRGMTLENLAALGQPIVVADEAAG